jgi:hypothetical protein
MRSEGTRHRSVGQAFEGCVSGAGSAGSCPPRAQEALGRMGFRAARGWVWCSPPRRATAKVPLRPGWCGWGAAMGCVAMRCGWVAFRSAPTGHGIPAQGETLGARHTQPMRSEGTRHRSVGQAFEGCVSGAGSAGSCPPRAQEALGRMGFRAARGWVWCSPPRRATAKVPLRPGWCDGVLRWGVLQ